MLVFLIPVLTEDVFAKTFDVVIPQGAANPTNLIHFLDSELTVSIDDKIRWINFDDSTHTVTSGSFQSGPNGVFNSGLLENGEVFTYIIESSNVGTMLYYCTIHPWMNGIISILDPDGMAMGRVTESGSVDAAKEHVKKANMFYLEANEFIQNSKTKNAGKSFSSSADHYNFAALEYGQLSMHEKAAFNHRNSAEHYFDAAIAYEISEDYENSIISHYNAGVQHHFAALQYGILDDQNNVRKHMSGNILHKRMAKFGSDYVLPPNLQTRFMESPIDISCREGFDLMLKSTTNQPVCVKPSSVAKLIERGWGKPSILSNN